MKISTDYKVKTEFEFDETALFSSIYKEILDSEGLYEDLSEAEVSLTLCDEEYIREINSEYRNIDKPTDVLSFPMIDTMGPCDFEIELFQDEELLLGDIVICVPKVYAQAEEYGHSIKRELGFLFTHGMLHLLGYDHIEDGDRILMENKQNEILMALNITR